MTMNNARAKRKLLPIYGPMDRFLLSRHDDDPKLDPLWQDKSRNSSEQLCNSSNSGCGPALENDISRKSKGHQNLIDWVWNYFSDEIVTTGAQRGKQRGGGGAAGLQRGEAEQREEACTQGTVQEADTQGRVQEKEGFAAGGSRHAEAETRERKKIDVKRCGEAPF